MCVSNTTFQCGKETLEKSVPEVIKRKDSDIHCEECMKHKSGEQLCVMHIDARKVFASCKPSMIKCIAGINHYWERIKRMDNSNTTTACPSCGEIED